jgi:DNA adenine methylase
VVGGDIMRYFGGKSSISKHIAKYINDSQYELYVEPFCGACNIATKVDIPNKTLNDKHKYLITMWKALQQGWIPPAELSEEQYRYIKNNKDENMALSGFVGFGCSFAGKWFGGFARNKEHQNYCLNAHNSVLKKFKTIKDAHFTCLDYKLLDIIQNSVIYCDPPYKYTTPYCKAEVGVFDYDEFLEWARFRNKDNIVLISEYKHNLPDDGVILLEIESRKSIRDKNGEQVKTTEILYTFRN